MAIDLLDLAKRIEQRQYWMPGEVFAILVKVRDQAIEDVIKAIEEYVPDEEPHVSIPPGSMPTLEDGTPCLSPLDTNT